MSIVRDEGLWPEGREKIRWAAQYMPLLSAIEARFSQEKPLRGIRVAVSVHLEAKTARLALCLAAGGADVAVTGSNPLSTQDAIAAALAHEGLAVFAWHGATAQEYAAHLRMTLAHGHQLIMDDGGDLVHLLHTELRDMAGEVIGGCEETTTGVLRLKAREKSGELLFPMVNVNDADAKHLFDNRYGTGQSVWDGIMRTTNLAVAGKVVVVAGYGWCGKGIARRAQGLGAQVIVTEVDAIKAIEAVMDGFRVMTMAEAAPLGDVFITATGCAGVITKAHFTQMKHGVLLANAGHFDVEVSKKDLAALARDIMPMRKNIQGYVMDDGRMLHLLGEGRLVNLACGDGHPVEIMDMSFALQALSLEHMAKEAGRLAPRVYAVPGAIDKEVARMKLEAMRVSIDTLSEEQARYLAGWEA